MAEKVTTRYVGFANKFKKEGDKQPDYKLYKDNGKDEKLSKYSIGAIWVGESKDKGTTYLSVSIDDKEYIPPEKDEESGVKPLKKTLAEKVKEDDEDQPKVKKEDLPF